MGVYQCQGPWVKGIGVGVCVWAMGKGVWDGCLTVFGPMGQRVQGMGVYKYRGPWVKGDRDGCLCMGHG